MQIPENYKTSYTKYLPGTSIRILLLLLIILSLVYFVVIPTIAKIKKDGVPPVKPLSFQTILPSGDPTTRDSDGDGIVDWQEIAIGLDPQKKETSAGTPDKQVYTLIKNKLGNDAFAQAINDSTTTDKLSLTIAHTINQSAATSGTTITESLSEISVSEILNYIESQKSTHTIYTSQDLTIVEGSLKNNQVYAAAMQNLLKNNPANDTILLDIKSYASGTGSQQKIAPALAAMSTAITQMKTMSVPSAASTLHISILNALQGFYQATEAIDPTTPDEVVRLGSLSILQDYAIQLATNVGKLPIYFSVALNANSYIQ